MRGRLAGTVALIVGAARGIGAGIVERFHEEGAHLTTGYGARLQLAAKRPHPLFSNSSRPISMRLISLVPAPIS